MVDHTGPDVPSDRPRSRSSFTSLRRELYSSRPAVPVAASSATFEADIDALTRWAAIVRSHHDLETVPRQAGDDFRW